MTPDKANEAHFDVAIVGGGFAGTALLWQLQKQRSDQAKRLRVVIFEPRSSLGEGVAYGTELPFHILNVTASKMSIDDQDPESLVRWLEEEKLPFSGQDYIPREIFHRYLQSVVSEAIKTTRVIRDTVREIRKRDGAFDITSTDGVITARSVILAMGNSPRGVRKESDYSPLKDPWKDESYEVSAIGSSVAIIGTGLSAVDVLVGLEASEYRGSYTLISRRGLLPQPHATHSTEDENVKSVAEHISSPSSLRTKLRQFRLRVREGLAPSAMIDALRQKTPQIWSSFTDSEKRLFIRRLRPYWDSFRHRIPVESAELIESLLQSGRLRVVRGHVEAVSRSESGRIRIQGAHGTLGSFDTAYDCRGLWSDLRNCQSPLLSQMIESNLARYDELYLGLKAGQDGTLLNKQLQPVPGLFTLGSLRRGELWETTAVREIRVQAKVIAARIFTERISHNCTP